LWLLAADLLLETRPRRGPSGRAGEPQQDKAEGSLKGSVGGGWDKDDGRWDWAGLQCNIELLMLGY